MDPHQQIVTFVATSKGSNLQVGVPKVKKSSFSSVLSFFASRAASQP
jgi:hypothetical protein